jgi:MOSC domain-containing protein YiiM
MSNPTTSKYFLPPTIVEAEAKVKADTGANNTSIEVDQSGEVAADAATEEAIELILDNPRFGEQVIVKGISAKDIAVGDIFEVEGGFSPLKVEVSSPRLPCSYVDKRNGSPFGMKGVKRYTMTEGLAGWFTRVLVPGELRDGMHLVRTAHPHPKWTLPEISAALYGEGPKRRQMLGYPYWNRSREELQELCNLKALGRVEWKDEAKWILDGNDSDYENDQRKKKEEAEKLAAEAAAAEMEAESQDLFSQNLAWVTGGLAACCGGVALATFCSPIFGQ